MDWGWGLQHESETNQSAKNNRRKWKKGCQGGFVAFLFASQQPKPGNKQLSTYLSTQVQTITSRLSIANHSHRGEWSPYQAPSCHVTERSCLEFVSSNRAVEPGIIYTLERKKRGKKRKSRTSDDGNNNEQGLETQNRAYQIQTSKSKFQGENKQKNKSKQLSTGD